MYKSQLKKSMIAYLMMLIMVLSSCAGGTSENGKRDGAGLSEKQSEEAEDAGKARLETDYRAEYYELEGSMENILDVKFADGFLYFKERDEESERYQIKRVNGRTGEAEVFLKAEAFEPEGQEASGEQERKVLRCFDITARGNILALTGCYAAEDEMGIYGKPKGWLLEEFDSRGNLLNVSELERDLISRNAYSIRMGVDDEGNILVAEDRLLLLSAEGKCIAEFPLKEGDNAKDIIRSGDGALYLILWNLESGNLVKRVDFEKGILENQDNLPEQTAGLGTVGSDGADAENEENAGEDFLVYTGDTLYRFGEGQKALTAVAQWNQLGIVGTQVLAVNLFGDSILAVSAENGGRAELTVLTPGNEVSAVQDQSEGQGKDQSQGQGQGLQERQVITLGVLFKFSIMDKMVARYNRSQKDYKVVIREYGELPSSGGTLDFQEPADRMMMDMLGDNPPDVLDLTSFLGGDLNLEPDCETLLERGYVEDLSAYLDRSEVIGLESFEERVLEEYTYESGLPAIPTSYTLQTLNVSGKELGERFGWSVEEFMAYDREHPAQVPLGTCYRDSIYKLCIQPNLETFVDFENRTVHFDTPAFRELLEYAMSYPQRQAGFYPINQEQEGLVRMELLSGIMNIQFVPNMTFEGEGHFIGYPTFDGTPLSWLKADSNAVSLAISARSTCKEGAWDFIEFVLSNDFSENNGASGWGGIPTNKDIFEEQVKTLADPEGPLKQMKISQSAFGVTYETHPLTQEEVEELYTLLDSARVQDSRMNTVMRIVYEELWALFADQKSMDQVIEVIENRVGIYLRE